MKGINFVINEKGKKKAVLIDLEEWGELWEDFSNILLSSSRENESEISWNELKQELDTAKMCIKNKKYLQLSFCWRL